MDGKGRTCRAAITAARVNYYFSAGANSCIPWNPPQVSARRISLLCSGLRRTTQMVEDSMF